MNRLFVNEIVSIGLVAAGDNPESTVEIYKSHREPVSIPGRAESPPGKPGDSMDLSAIEDKDLRKSIEDHIAESDTKISDLTKQVDDLTPDDDIVKDAPEEIQAIIAKLEADAAQDRKDLAAERKERLATEYVARAELLQGLLGKAEEMGPVLADLADAAPDAFAKLEGALTAASQRAELADLFKEIGTGDSESESDPIAKRDSWVEANKKDGETVDQTRSRFWKENPEAVEESRS